MVLQRQTAGQMGLWHQIETTDMLAILPQQALRDLRALFVI
jgi:hypothetical protein